MVSNVWDYLSLLPMFYLCVLVIATWFDRTYGLVVVGALVVSMFTESIKAMSRPWLDRCAWLQRPLGATNCNCLNNNGDVGGTAGFPSGHVATMAFIMTSLVVYARRSSCHQPIIVWTWIAYGVAAVCIVALARLKKNCHTPLQVGVGALIGVITSFAFHSF